MVVDVANVMGARADGWWRDRAGAAARLHDEIVALAAESPTISEWVLVLEGRANKAAAEGGDRVRVVRAPGSGDDAIAGLAAGMPGSRPGSCLVVTADRELRRRCREAGAEVTGPGWLLRRLRPLHTMRQ